MSDKPLWEIRYCVPYEGDCILSDQTTADVLAFLERNVTGFYEQIEIVPMAAASYDRDEFVAAFGGATHG